LAHIITRSFVTKLTVCLHAPHAAPLTTQSCFCLNEMALKCPADKSDAILLGTESHAHSSCCSSLGSVNVAGCSVPLQNRANAAVNFDSLRIKFYNAIVWFLCHCTAFLHRPSSATVQVLKSHKVHWFSKP